VGNKNKACAACGIQSLAYTLPETATQEKLLDLIDALNRSPIVHGVLVQLPLPEHIDEKTVLQAIAPEKDLDGFHMQNAGALMVGEDGFVPCTPAGIMELLARYDIPIDGKHAVICGRSNTVGKPLSMLMLRHNATVTICHTHTQNLREITRQADILVAAIGDPRYFDSSYIKDGAVVIDVGIHRMEDGKLCGDVDFDDVAPHVSAITPVPGGVGAMTVAMLLKNCIRAAKLACLPDK
jgi:methylenetetrahydrofolate dehydrogenase (NADP+)/methenyltetrahydrofolate cyclohydrolase